MNQSKIKGILWMIFVFLFYMFSDTYFSFVLLILTIVLSALLYFTVLYLKNKVDISLQGSGTMNKNNIEKLIIKAENKSVFPISKVKSVINVRNQLTGEVMKQEIYFSLNGKAKEHISVDMTSKYCGKIQINIKELVFYDYLGFFSKTIKINAFSDVYVLPNIFSIRILDGDTQMSSLENSYQGVQVQGLDSSDLMGISEYLPGDSLKSIHWKLTSKFGELIVKEFSEPTDRSYLILLENSLAEENVGDSPDVTDATMEAFVSISKALTDEGKTHSIGWLSHDTQRIYMEQVYSLEQLTDLLKTLLTLEKKATKTSAMEQYYHTVDPNLFSNIIYINTSHSKSVKQDDHVLGKIRTITCEGNNKELTKREDKEITFTPKNMKQQLGQLVI